MMKRILLTAALLLSVISSYGSYYDYEEPEPSGWVTFMSIVFIVFGILQIILFFKVWGMTNDVKALKSKLTDDQSPCNYYSLSELRANLSKNIVLGNDKEVERLLLLKFMNSIEHECDPKYSFTVNTLEEGLKKDITPWVKLLSKQLAKIGKEVPAVVANMKTYRDFRELYTNEDFQLPEEPKPEEAKSE